MNKRGPRVQPWETPVLIYNFSDPVSLISRFCFFLLQEVAKPFKYFCRYTYSSALHKSRKNCNYYVISVQRFYQVLQSDLSCSYASVLIVALLTDCFLQNHL